MFNSSLKFQPIPQIEEPYNLPLGSKESLETRCVTDRPSTCSVNLNSQKEQKEQRKEPITSIKTLPNQMIPGMRFGRYFGSIQQATQRQIKTRMTERLGTVPSDTQVIKETVRGLSKGRQLSTSQKILMKKMQEIEKKMKKYKQLNPKLQKENSELKQQNRVIRTQSDVLKQKTEKWEKYNKQKSEELNRSMQNHHVLRTRMVKIYNQPKKIKGRVIKASGTK